METEEMAIRTTTKMQMQPLLVEMRMLDRLALERLVLEGLVDKPVDRLVDGLVDGLVPVLELQMLHKLVLELVPELEPEPLDRVMEMETAEDEASRTTG